MASNSSGPLSPGESYTLGQYTFSISSQYDSGADTTYITADCTYGEDAGVKQTSVDGEAEIVSWNVEVSDNVADVYAETRVKVESDKTSDLDTSPISQPVPTSSSASTSITLDAGNKPRRRHYDYYCYDGCICLFVSGNSVSGIAASSSPNATLESVQTFTYSNGTVKTWEHTSTLVAGFTYQGKTVYVQYGIGDSGYSLDGASGAVVYEYLPNDRNLKARIAWTMVYGDESDAKYDEETVFVARFQIVPEDADPEDWDDPIDDGDPELVLKVTVRGALSGRHNDPYLLDSFSYVPADNPAEKDYGCGGDGGYGGGGGAGASTVIVYKYSTSKAGSHETYAYARRHGYGSGGGKGGRGGDGCIIIYW